jgi:predicted dehydrogenase
VGEAEQLRATLGDIRVQVGFIERFNPAVRQLKKILDQSPQVINVDFTRTNRVSARITDVDVITDLMIHDIDLALHLNGPVSAVHAHGTRMNGMIDFASAVLEHKNGRFARVLASRITEKKIRSIQATCSDKFVDCDLLRKEILINKQSELRTAPGEPYVISAVEEAVEVPPTEALLAELQAFVAFCRGEAVEVPTAEDAVQALAVCDTVQKAIRK